MNMASHPSERTRWRLFFAFVAVSLLLLVLDTSGYLSTVVGYLQTPIAVVQGWVTGRMNTIESTLDAPRDRAILQAENEQLKNRIADLERQNEELLEVYAEYTLLSALLQYARENPEYRRVAADIIGWDVSNFARRFTINKGERDGIRIGMPVETERGLVGRVVTVAPRSAQVQLLTDPGSAINARLGASRADGVVQGNLSSTLYMKWIEQDIPISENELVMTSGLGGNFPPDLVIGRVASFKQSISELFQEAEVRPAVNFDQLEIVLVIIDFEPAFVTQEQTDD